MKWLPATSHTQVGDRGNIVGSLERVVGSDGSKSQKSPLVTIKAKKGSPKHQCLPINM